MKRLYPVFNTVKLTPALSNPIEGCHFLPSLAPEIVDREEEWIIEEILDSKMINWKLHYLVKLEGFGMEHNSWEPWDNVHAPELVMDFHQRHPRATRHIRAAVLTRSHFELHLL
jgi:Chromo (CHRromatin Organisation MOdifier) domain